MADGMALAEEAVAVGTGGAGPGLAALRETLSTLARVRRDLAARRAEARMLQVRVDSLPEAQALQEAHRALRDAEVAEGALLRAARDCAMAAFRATGDKQPVPGVQIKVFQKTTYPDMGRLLDWCLMNAPTYVGVDTQGFGKVAEEMRERGAPVEIGLEPRATVATNLEHYLEDADGQA